MSYVQLQMSVVGDVFGLVQQVRHQFLSGRPRVTRVVKQAQCKRAQHVPRHREMLWRHGIIVMEVRQVRRVLEVTLDDIAGISSGCDAMKVEPTHFFVGQKLEISDRQWLALGGGI